MSLVLRCKDQVIAKIRVVLVEFVMAVTAAAHCNEIFGPWWREKAFGGNVITVQVMRKPTVYATFFLLFGGHILSYSREFCDISWSNTMLTICLPAIFWAGQRSYGRTILAQGVP